MKTVPTSELTIVDVPQPDADNGEIIRFAQLLNGYTEVGGDAANLGRYLKELDGGEGKYLKDPDEGMLEVLSLNDLRILLFARQRAHYHSGGGWGDDDPIMDDMRRMIQVVRKKLEGSLDQLSVRQGDITELRVDAIVNAANPALEGGGGVDRAIHVNAGPELREACQAILEVTPGVRCPIGQARITPGFHLPANHVIHAVGPQWIDGSHGEEDLLASAYRAALELAARHEVRSIAFPGISTGAFGFPQEKAAGIGIRTIRAFMAENELPSLVILVAFDTDAERVLKTALEA